MAFILGYSLGALFSEVLDYVRRLVGSAIKLICGIALVFSLLMLGEGVVLGIMIALAVCLGAALLQY